MQLLKQFYCARKLRHKLPQFIAVCVMDLKSFNVAGADHVKILGTISDSSPTMDNHTNSVSKSRFYTSAHFVRYVAIRTTVLHCLSFLLSRLRRPTRFCFVLGCLLKYRSRLQRVQNAPAQNIATKWREDASRTYLYHHAKFRDSWLHRCRDISPWTKKQ